MMGFLCLKSSYVWGYDDFNVKYILRINDIFRYPANKICTAIGCMSNAIGEFVWAIANETLNARIMKKEIFTWMFRLIS